jgi:hypothetical protein
MQLAGPARLMHLRIYMSSQLLSWCGEFTVRQCTKPATAMQITMSATLSCLYSKTANGYI